MSNQQFEQHAAPAQPPPMAPPPGYGAYGGPMAMRWGVRNRYPIETKPFFLTSEFLAFAIGTIALIITAAVDNSIDSRFFWVVEGGLIGLYMLSRGIAKAGTKSRSADPREDLLDRDGARATRT